MFYYLLVLFHIAVCVGIVFFVLIQSNKGMGLSGAFGSMGASDSVLGASGGVNVIMKITIGFSVVFAVMCITLCIIPPPVHTGGIAEEQFGNPLSVTDLIEQSKAGGNDITLPDPVNDAKPSSP